MGNILSFGLGIISREIFEYVRSFARVNQRENHAPLAVDQNRILAIERPEILQIEGPQNIPNQAPSGYEVNREQWWQRFENPIYQGTRSRYRQTSNNAAEENHYQLM